MEQPSLRVCNMFLPGHVPYYLRVQSARRGPEPEWLEIIAMSEGGMLLARDTPNGPPVVERWFMHEPARLAVAQRLADGITHVARYRHAVAWVGTFSLAYLPYPVPDPCRETPHGHGHFTSALS